MNALVGLPGNACKTCRNGNGSVLQARLTVKNLLISTHANVNSATILSAPFPDRLQANALIRVEPDASCDWLSRCQASSFYMADKLYGQASLVPERGVAQYNLAHTSRFCSAFATASDLEWTWSLS